MSSTLFVRPTPKPTKTEWHFKLPVKHIIARRFYDHDGSLGGTMITVGSDHLDWFEGLLAGAKFEASDMKALTEIVEVLREGRTIDMWFET